MAGGWAAGKTRIVEKLRATGSTLPDLTWDGTLGDTSWASTQIQSALAKGWRVEVVYVHRNIELAIYGAIERGRSEGRFVPLNELPKNHRSVQSSIAKLIDEFADTISFQLFHNTGSSNIPGIALPFDQESLAPDGALHYSLSYETYYQSAADKIYRSAGG